MWFEAFKKSVADIGVRKTATKLGLSPAQVSLTMRGKERSQKLIFKRVIERLMQINIICPIYDEIDQKICAEQQNLPFTTANPERIALFRACRACPNFKGA